MTEHFDNGWQQVLANFDALWTLKADWFEEPNTRRGGWSGVIKYPLATSNSIIDVFIKRQENHITKTLLHPVNGIATFQKEFRNIQLLTNKKIPTLELVYFGLRDKQAILISKSLEGYNSLDSGIFQNIAYQQKRALLSKIAITTANMHHWHF